MFKNRDTNTSPLFIGPMLIHKRMDFSTYHYFASQLISLCPSLTHIRSFGTDGEKALYEAFSATFPEAVHVRCFNHFKANVEEKLKDLHGRHEIIADIFLMESRSSV